jgi:hypothetical protein
VRRGESGVFARVFDRSFDAEGAEVSQGTQRKATRDEDCAKDERLASFISLAFLFLFSFSFVLLLSLLPVMNLAAMAFLCVLCENLCVLCV